MTPSENYTPSADQLSEQMDSIDKSQESMTKLSEHENDSSYNNELNQELSNNTDPKVTDAVNANKEESNEWDTHTIWESYTLAWLRDFWMLGKDVTLTEVKTYTKPDWSEWKMWISDQWDEYDLTYFKEARERPQNNKQKEEVVEKELTPEERHDNIVQELTNSNYYSMIDAWQNPNSFAIPWSEMDIEMKRYKAEYASKNWNEWIKTRSIEFNDNNELSKEALNWQDPDGFNKVHAEEWISDTTKDTLAQYAKENGVDLTEEQKNNITKWTDHNWKPVFVINHPDYWEIEIWSSSEVEDVTVKEEKEEVTTNELSKEALNWNDPDGFNKVHAEEWISDTTKDTLAQYAKENGVDLTEEQKNNITKWTDHNWKPVFVINHPDYWEIEIWSSSEVEDVTVKEEKEEVDNVTVKENTKEENPWFNQEELAILERTKEWTLTDKDKADIMFSDNNDFKEQWEQISEAQTVKNHNKENNKDSDKIASEKPVEVYNNNWKPDEIKSKMIWSLEKYKEYSSAIKDIYNTKGMTLKDQQRVKNDPNTRMITYSKNEKWDQIMNVIKKKVS